jgi:Putative Ig domain
VGQSTWEEIDDGIAGSNYGWPNSEGPTSAPAETGPFYYYGHGTGPFLGCAIAGGAFYNPAVAPFPAGYVGSYFFADYCGGWINRVDAPATGNAVSTFASGISFPVDLQVGPDGFLYYLARGSGSTTGLVGRIQYGGGGFAISNASGLPAGRVGTPYSQQLQASGGTGTLTWTKTSGTLPRGLSLSAGGQLSGTPTKPGSYTFTVQVVDSSVPQKTATKTFT